MNDLLFTQGQDNLAGIIGELAIVPVADIDTLPALAAATSLNITGDIVLDSGKAWKRLYMTDETGMVETKPLGEVDGKGAETIIKCRYPKYGRALIDWIRSVQNTPCLLSYKLAADGKRYVVGLTQPDISSTTVTTDIPVTFVGAEGGSGGARGDRNGAELSWRFAAGHGPVEYSGAMDFT